MQDRPLQIVFAGHHQGRGDFPSHHHEVWELVYVSDGTVITYQDEVAYRLSTGTVLVNPPRVPHRDVFVRPYQLIYLFAEGSVFEGCGPLLYDLPDQSFGHLFDSILREWNEQWSQREEMLRSLAAQLEILIRRQSRAQTESEPDRWLIEAERLLRESVASPMTLDVIAEKVGVSRSWLHQSFREAFGRSPHEYVTQLRLERALAHIRLSSHKVAFIAEACGYASASHLTNHVRKVTGLSPSAIREGATVGLGRDQVGHSPSQLPSHDQ